MTDAVARWDAVGTLSVQRAVGVAVVLVPADERRPQYDVPLAVGTSATRLRPYRFGRDVRILRDILERLGN